MRRGFMAKRAGEEQVYDAPREKARFGGGRAGTRERDSRREKGATTEDSTRDAAAHSRALESLPFAINPEIKFRKQCVTWRLMGCFLPFAKRAG